MKKIISILVLLAILAGGLYYLTGKGNNSQKGAVEVEKAVERVKGKLDKAQQKADEQNKQIEQLD